jgi:hypothetical protein
MREYSFASSQMASITFRIETIMWHTYLFYCCRLFCDTVRVHTLYVGQYMTDELERIWTDTYVV